MPPSLRLFLALTLVLSHAFATPPKKANPKSCDFGKVSNPKVGFTDVVHLNKTDQYQLIEGTFSAILQVYTPDKSGYLKTTYSLTHSLGITKEHVDTLPPGAAPVARETTIIFGQDPGPNDRTRFETLQIHRKNENGQYDVTKYTLDEVEFRREATQSSTPPANRERIQLRNQVGGAVILDFIERNDISPENFKERLRQVSKMSLDKKVSPHLLTAYYCLLETGYEKLSDRIANARKRDPQLTVEVVKRHLKSGFTEEEKLKTLTPEDVPYRDLVDGIRFLEQNGFGNDSDYLKKILITQLK